MSYLGTALALGGLALVLGAVYGLVRLLACQRYWKNKNIYTLRTRVPLVGQMGNLIFKKQSFPEVVHDFYKELKEKNLEYGGVYMFTRPSLVITSPELIQEVTVKQFEHFVNRRPFVDAELDKLLGRSLLGLQNEEWRQMRHHLSPAFTGSKLRGMLGLIESTCDKFNDFLSNRPDHDEPLDLYSSFRRLAADLIATTAFGSPSDSISDPESDFYKNGIKVMDFSGKRTLLMMGYLLSPALMKLLNLPFIPDSLNKFFNGMIKNNIEYREKQNKSRADMIQLLLDARKADPSHYIEDSDIASQAFTFFLGGFDTMATAFSFTSHCMAMHPELQAKVRQEVREVAERHGGKIGYDELKELEYMDKFIAEVLRLHPLAPLLDRLCSKNVTFPEYNLTLEKGSSVLMPIYGLHHDPEYFPDPERFDPERFSEENKRNIKPYTYLPFGEGPRNCIGKRFALLELKMGISKILSQHEFLVGAKTNTKTPFEYTRATTLLQPEGGFWLNVKPLSPEDRFKVL